MTKRPTRNAVAALLGTPDYTEGSVNDPREREEHGIRFNEKWVYSHLRSDPAGVPMRTIYWWRYDFMGTVVRGSADEPWRPDSKLLEALDPSRDRLAPIDPTHNAPIIPSNRYRPASDFKGKPDLGGRIADE